MTVFSNYRQSSRMISTPNHCPRGTPMKSARAGEARPWGKAGSERRKACFHPGGSGFHLPRGRGGRWAAGGQGHTQFNSIDFYVTTQPSLLLSSLKKVTSFPASKTTALFYHNRRYLRNRAQADDSSFAAEIPRKSRIDTY